MKNHLTEYLENHYEEITPRGFYRSIFPNGALEEKGQQIAGKYNAIAIELFPKDEKGKVKVNRYIVNDDLNKIDELLDSDNFIIISPISYCGKSREAKNARYIYAIAFDLDGVNDTQYITDLFYQMGNKVLPTPTYTVCSGNGLHLYYQLEEPVPCYENIVSQLSALKNDLTRQIWNRYTTELYKNPQIESLFQGFRMVGGITKDGIHRTRAFITGKKVSIGYLNDFAKEENRVKDLERYNKRGLSLYKASKKYPEWYERRIIEQQPKGKWVCKRALFEWWLRRIKEEAKEGHRYYCIMCLAIYAKKSGIDREELEKIAFDLVEELDTLTTRENNSFTNDDVLKALEMYNDDYISFPIDSIVNITNIKIEKNKRNRRKQKSHIEYMNTIRLFKIKMGEITLKGVAGRKTTKEHIVKEWREANPTGTQYRCSKDTGLSINTVKKWWLNG